MDMGPATLTTDPKNPKILIATLPDKLDPGTYNVVWHVVATDTHKTDGSYTFSVKPDPTAAASLRKGGGREPDTSDSMTAEQTQIDGTWSSSWQDETVRSR